MKNSIFTSLGVVGLLATLLLPSVVFAEDHLPTACVNSNIVAYFPIAPSWSDNSYLYFFTKKDVQVSSFRAYVNGEAKPVEYKTIGPFYRARVVIEPTDKPVESVFSVGKAGACNTPVAYTFDRV